MSLKLNIYTKEDVLPHISTRKGETKLGETITFLNQTHLSKGIENSNAKYVIFGIPEDIGVQGNNGIKGTRNTWTHFLNSFLNIQENNYNKGNDMLLLGYLDCSKVLEYIDTLNSDKKKFKTACYSTVAAIDEWVTHIVTTIVKYGKKPIIIGGGHNNAYGNIKGTALALNKPINAINFDAHTDFRNLEGRHSGNGFSYAFKEGFLKNYFIFGLHENYTSKTVFKQISKHYDTINYNTFEAIQVRKETSFKKEIKYAKKWIANNKFGLEIDCDAIQDISSSAITPSGFSVNQARMFVSYFGALKNVQYLHLCEASTTENETSSTRKIGKLLTYIVTDFMRSSH